MTHTYNITGMTCGGCVAGVKSKLLKTPHILSAEVQLDAPQATIEMDAHISTSHLQEVLGNGKYTITDSIQNVPSAPATATATATAPVSYYPIFLIFGFITGITLLIQYTSGAFSLMMWMNDFMAGFFLLFSFFKLLNIKGFAEGYGTYDIVASKIPLYGYVYPFIELALGLAYVAHFRPMVTNTVTLVVMSISTIGVVRSIARKSNFQCACLGTIIKLPLSKVTLFEDVLMVLMSLAMIIKLY